MFKIMPDNKIKLTKGDTATIKVEVYDDEDKPYVIKDTDVIKLEIKQNANSSALITKTADSNHKIIINATDTSSLQPGVYVYDVQLTSDAGNTYTIIPINFFDLLEEIN